MFSTIHSSESKHVIEMPTISPTTLGNSEIKPETQHLHSEESTLHPHSCINIGCITRTNQIGLAILSTSFFAFSAYKYSLGETPLACISLLLSLMPPLSACWLEKLKALAQRGLEINEAKKTALLFKETTIHTNENMKNQQTGLNQLHNDLTQTAQTLAHIEEVIEEEEAKGQTLADTIIQSIEENARSQAEDHLQLQAASELAEKQKIQLAKEQKKLQDLSKQISPEIKLYSQTVEMLHAEINKFKEESEKHFKLAEEYKKSLERAQKNTEEIILERKTFQLEIEQMAAQIKELSNKIEELNAEIASLQKEKSSSVNLIETLEKRIKSNGELINEFNTRVDPETWKEFREFIHTIGNEHKRQKSPFTEFKPQ